MIQLTYKKLIISLVLVALFSHTEAMTLQLERKRALEHTLDALITAQAPTATVGIKVVTLDDNMCLYEKNSTNLLIPASTLKLVTAAAALYYLGSAYQFETQILSDGILTNGVLQGNLYIKFSGDPSLVTRDLEQLVLELKKKGITTITGTVAIDASTFDDMHMGPGWMWDQGPAFYNSPVYACTVNHNCITVSVKPAESIDTAPIVFIEPAGAGRLITVDNRAITTDTPKSKLSIERDWQGRTDKITIEGALKSDSAIKIQQCTVEQPLVYGAVLCKQLLEQADITLQGELIKASAPESAHVLATHTSVSLGQLLHTMLKQSDNLYAECLCKTLGAYKQGVPGTWTKGATVLNNFLSTVVGITGDFKIVDGSGFSRYNLISADQLVQLLLWVSKHFTLSYEFTAALARAGQDGTLKQRMQQESSYQIRAKTGTLAGVSALSGYCHTKIGQTLAFAIIVNGFTKPAQEYKTKLEDALMYCLGTDEHDQK